MRRPQGFWGLTLPAPLRRFCSNCASRGSAGKLREPRFARLADRRDGGAGDGFLAPARTATLQCPAFAPTLARDSSAKAPGDAAPLRPWRATQSGWQKKAQGEARLDLSSTGWKIGGRWPREPLPGRPPAAGTYLDPLLRLGEGGLGGRLWLQGLKSFQTESGTSHLRSPASTRALGRQDENGRRRRRSVLPAPSRPPAFPLPRTPLLRPRRSPRRAALAAGGHRGSCSQPCSAAPGVPRGSERGGAGSSLCSPPSLAAPPPPGTGGVGCQLPTKNNQEGGLGVSLPAHNRTRRGTRPAAPHFPGQGCLRRGGRNEQHLGDARGAGRTNPRRARASATRQEVARVVAAPHLLSLLLPKWGQEDSPLTQRQGGFSHLIFCKKDDPYKPFSLWASYLCPSLL